MAGIFRFYKTRLRKSQSQSLSRLFRQSLPLILVLVACGTSPQETTPAALATNPAGAPTLVETTPPQTVAQATETEAPAMSPTTAEPAAAGTATADPNALSSQPEAPPELKCTSPADPTPAMTEGPYYTPDTPERLSLLEPGMEGIRLVISGYVLTVDCQPIPGAWLDFWQADANGEYDNEGFRLRGHQFTDAQGRYQLETVLPGEYPGRTQHIHVKVQAPGGGPPGGEVLTSQLFFPGATGNESDSIFSSDLVVEMERTESGLAGHFNFVLDR